MAAVLAGLFVVGASYGVSALVVPHLAGQPMSSQGNERMIGMAARPSAQFVPSSQFIATGRGLYSQVCSSCHGANAQGGYGPNLHGLELPDTRVAYVIKNGVTGRMPGFSDKYNAAQQQALVVYVQSLKK